MGKVVKASKKEGSEEPKQDKQSVYNGDKTYIPEFIADLEDDDQDEPDVTEPDDKQDEPIDNDDGDDKIDYKAAFEELQKKTDKLMEELEKLSRQKASGDDDKKLGDPGEPGKPKNPPAVVKFLDESALDDDSFVKILSDKKAFVETLNEFGNAVAAAASERVLKDIPEIVQSATTFTVEFTEINREFFKKYPELVPIRKYVSAAMDELVRERNINDLDDYRKALEDLPGILEERLGMNLTKRDDRQQQQQKKGPGQAAPTGQRKGKPKEDLSLLELDFKRSLEYSKRKKGLI